MSVRPPGPLSYTGEVAVPFIVKTFPPTAAFNKFNVPTVWIDTIAMEAYILVSLDLGTAEWIKIGSISGQVEQFNVDTSTAPGTDPVLPDGSYTINITGGQVASGTTANVIQTNSLAANSFTIQVQRSGTAASANSDVNGVCHFNSSHFTVDGDGFVSLVGGSAAVDSFTTNVGGPVLPNASGGVLVNASSTTYTDGSVANTLKTELQGTNHALFVGQGTNTPATTIAVGTTGQLLVGSSSANPAFGSSAEGDFAFTQSTNPSTTPRKIVVSNADTANSASDSSFIAAVGGASSGDAYSLYSVGSTVAWSLGPDTSDSGAFKINYNASSSVTPSSGINIVKTSVSGAIDFPLQPYLTLVQVTDIPNALGNNTLTITTWTEQVNRRSGSYSGGTYTIPEDGNYLIMFGIGLQNLQAAHTDMSMIIKINSSDLIIGGQCSPGQCRSGGGGLHKIASTCLSLSSGDTVEFKTTVINGTQVVTLQGNGGGPVTYANIYKLA